MTWSAGETLDAKTIAQAFKLPEAADCGAGARRHADQRRPFGRRQAWSSRVVVILVILALVDSCSDDDCDELRRTFGEASNEYQQCKRSGAGGGWFRSSGGSYGGFGFGGSHK